MGAAAFCGIIKVIVSTYPNSFPSSIKLARYTKVVAYSIAIVSTPAT
jgi:hypothetical protein